MFKFVPWTYTSGLMHTWIHQISDMAIPICLTCCVGIMIHGIAKTTFAVERQVIFKFSCSSDNYWYGLSYSGINFIRGNIDEYFWINALKSRKNFMAELYAGFRESVFSPNTVSDITAERAKQDGTSNFIKVVNNKIKHWDDDWLYWFLIVVIL